MTRGVCLLAAVLEAVLACASTAGLSPSDAIILLLIVGPYLALTGLAWRNRQRALASRWLLLAAVVLAVIGMVVWGIDSYDYHTDSLYRLQLRIAGFLTACGQWIAVVGLALGLYATRLPRSR